MSDVAWGTFPDWIAAIGTVGALLVGGRLLLKELRVQRARDEDARRAQASKVSAWIVVHGAYGQTQPNVAYELFARNGSDEPVYDFKVTNANGEFYRLVLPPDPQPLKTRFRREGQEVTALRSTKRENRKVTVTFRDANGRTWQRGPEGILELIEPEHIPS